MELGLSGRTALVCASSQGLGLACATALAREGAAVTINGRSAERLERAVTVIRERTGRVVQAVSADLDTEDGRAALVAASPEPDILVTNNSGPPPGRLEDWDRSAWMKAIEANMLAPILLIEALVPGMRRRRFGRIVNITSGMVKSPAFVMSLSTAARTGLTAFAKGLAREAAADNVTVNNLLPYRIDTERQAFLARRTATERGIPVEQVYAEVAASVAAKRLGRPEEFADACAYLCSTQAGFISGQSILVDGGSFVGLM